MASLIPVWIVQDRASHLFLKPQDGDVGYTPFINEAGYFEEAEAAIETANDWCDDGYIVFSCHVTHLKKVNE